jgi:prevent-host-death family protein
VYITKYTLEQENRVEVTTKQLRIQPGRIISRVNKGQEITITYRGKACAKIVPLTRKNSRRDDEDELFGMWKNREDIKDVDQYVRHMRKGRIPC